MWTWLGARGNKEFREFTPLFLFEVAALGAFAVVGPCLG